VKLGTRPCIHTFLFSIALKHLEPLKKFVALVGKDSSGMGILVCRVEKNTPMPSGTLAIPWAEFPKWLKSKFKNSVS
jgi:hypothetical protein